MRKIKAKVIGDALSLSIWSDSKTDQIWDILIGAELARSVDISPTYNAERYLKSLEGAVPDGWSCHIMIRPKD